MNLKQVTSVYFSPTQRTKRVTERIASRLGISSESVDLTDAVKRRPDYSFTENEAVVVGVPVYGGRVPSTAAERLKKLHGRQTPAVLVVTYGNRAYEDALAELGDILTEQGFRPAAAAAVVTEHSIVHKIAEGRPDKADLQKLDRFADEVREKLRTCASNYQLPEFSVKGNKPYRPYHVMPLKLKVGSSCNGCGTCIRKCPVQAISRTDPRVTDEQRCIACMRCADVCPTGSRKLGTLMQLAITQKLKKICAERKEPDFFI